MLEADLPSDRIMFMREFKAIDSASSVVQLRRRLKAEEMEQFGEPFTPDYVYEAIRKTGQFSSMIVRSLSVNPLAPRWR